jgi:hypothetical protein
MSESIQSAFPWVSHGGVSEHQVVEAGLTKREYIAAMVMGSALLQYGIATAAAMSVEATDALLTELAKAQS